MVDFLYSTLVWIWAWVIAHPSETIVIAWMIFNVIAAQVPKPKSAAGMFVYNILTAVFQTVVTHKDEPGTFKLPFLIRAIVQALSGAATRDSQDPPARPQMNTTPDKGSPTDDSKPGA